MPLAGRGAQHHRAAGAAPAHEPRAEAADQPQHDARGPVLDRDVELTALPPLADGCHRRGDHVEVHGVEIGATGERVLDHTPRTAGITHQQT
jgi:hypothetical protein